MSSGLTSAPLELIGLNNLCKPRILITLVFKTEYQPQPILRHAERTQEEGPVQDVIAFHSASHIVQHKAAKRKAGQIKHSIQKTIYIYKTYILKYLPTQ